MTAQQIPSANGDDITMRELLDSSKLHDLTVRYICAARKVLAANGELAEHEIDLGYDLNRLYHSFGVVGRKQAFDSAPAHKSIGSEIIAVLPKPQAKKTRQNYACCLTVTHAETLALRAIEEMQPGKEVFTFAELKEAVKALHLSGGKQFLPEDLKPTPSNMQPKWIERLSTAVNKLRTKDVIAYRPTKKNYFIF